MFVFSYFSRHNEHSNFGSSECCRCMCSVKFQRFWKHLPHSVHLCTLVSLALFRSVSTRLNVLALLSTFNCTIVLGCISHGCWVCALYSIFVQNSREHDLHLFADCLLQWSRSWFLVLNLNERKTVNNFCIENEWSRHTHFLWHNLQSNVIRVSSFELEFECIFKCFVNFDRFRNHRSQSGHLCSTSPNSLIFASYESLDTSGFVTVDVWLLSVYDAGLMPICCDGNVCE